MEIKFELETSEMECCRNNFFEACVSDAKTQLAFAAWLNDDSLSLVTHTWSAKPYTGASNFTRHIARMTSTGAAVDAIMTQTGRIKVGRSYTVTYKYQVVGIGVGATYGLKVTVGGTTQTISVAGAVSQSSFTVTAADDTIEFRTDNRNDVDFYWITVKENHGPVEVTNPIDLSQFELVHKRDSTFHGLFPEAPVKATFGTDGFEFLNELLERLGNTVILLCTISYRCGPADSWATLFDGVIDMNAAEVMCDRISVVIEDAGLAAKLVRFKGHLYDMRDPVAINGDEVTAPTFYACDHYFSAGSVSRDNLFFYHAFETLGFCISNNVLVLDAPALEHVAFAGATGASGNITLCDGWDLRKYVTPGPFNISLEEAFEAFDRLKNAGLYVYDNAGTKTIKILAYTGLFVNTKLTLTNDLYGIKNLKWSLFTEISYSTMRIGYSEYDKDDANEEWGELQLKFLSFLGSDQELDLRNNWIGSKLLIEDQKNVGTLPARSENDDQKYIVYVDGAATSPLDSEGAAWASYNDSVSPQNIQEGLMALRQDYAAYSAREQVNSFARDYNDSAGLFEYLYEFTAPLSIADFVTILNNQTNYLEISTETSPAAADLIKVWVWEISYNVLKGEARIKAISKQE